MYSCYHCASIKDSLLHNLHYGQLMSPLQATAVTRSYWCIIILGWSNYNSCNFKNVFCNTLSLIAFQVYNIFYPRFNLYSILLVIIQMIRN